MDILPFVIGVVVGAVIWYFTFRRWSLQRDADRRREMGLPPRKGRL